MSNSQGRLGIKSFASDVLRLRTALNIQAIVRAIKPLVVAQYTSNTAWEMAEAWTTVNYEDQVYDSHSAVTTGASWKFTAPYDGYYHVSACIGIASTTAWQETEQLVLRIYKNGTAAMTLGKTLGVDTSTAARLLNVSGSATIYLDAGDYIHISCYQNSGASRYLETSAVENHVSIELV